MSARRTVFALALLASLLVTGCGLPQSSATPISPTAELTRRAATTPVPQTATPIAPRPVTPAGASLGDTRSRPADGMTMVNVPGGAFLMGGGDEQIDMARALCDEYPDDYGK